MNSEIKKNSLSIKTMFYLVSFSVVILFLLWIIQIGFLKIFYERYRINTINNIATKILNNKDDLAEELEKMAYEYDICIELQAFGQSYNYNILNRDCLFKSRNISVLEAKTRIYNSPETRNIVTIENPDNNSKSLIYGLRLNDNVYVFLNTKLEDVNSTTSILMNQLIYITLMVIMLAIIMSVFVSRRLNRPILNITEKARRMAVGDFSLDETDYGIAEINELNTVLNYARSEIRNTDELRRDLMANVSHDLKTPLTMIKAYAEMAMDINSDNKAKRNENLAVIMSEADRLNVLVNDVLDLSKLEHGKMGTNKSVYDLTNEINEILKRYEIIKETEKYKFEVNMPESAFVKADKSKINQVIYNLINNAINYTGDDLVVKINVKENHGYYLVEIIDTGKGISGEDLPLIWTKYYKKEKKHKRNLVGTGLGLSIVKNILTEHNFKYGVDSKKGKGTKFYFQILKGKRPKEKP